MGVWKQSSQSWRLLEGAVVKIRPEGNSYNIMWANWELVIMLAQLVEHCTNIAEVMGSNPVQA